MYFVYVIDVKRNDLTINHKNNAAKSQSLLPITLSIDKTMQHDVESSLLFSNLVVEVEYENEMMEESNSAENCLSEYNDEDLPSHWTTCRKYEEFFLLEKKMREFHGNALRLDMLPDRKNFLMVLLKKTLNFICSI